MTSPKVSIITVVYNAAQLLELTVKSVQQQTYPNIEYIVIDGGSTDGTLEIIRNHQQEIDGYISEKDSGIYDAMNKGIALASGDWIMFLNAGDLFAEPDTLKTIFGTISGGPSIIYGDSILLHSDRQTVQPAKPLTKFNLIFWGTRTVCHQAMLVRKDIMVNYDPKLKLKGELDWYFKLIGHPSFSNAQHVAYPVIRYLMGGVGQKRKYQNLKEAISVLFAHAGIASVIATPVMIYRLIKN